MPRPVPPQMKSGLCRRPPPPAAAIDAACASWFVGPDDEARERVLRVQPFERRRGEPERRGRPGPLSRRRGRRHDGMHTGRALGLEVRRARRGRRGARADGHRQGGGPNGKSAWPHRRRARLIGDRGRERPVDGPRDLHAPARRFADVIRKRREEMVLHPFAHELVARTQAENAVVERVELHAREPLVEARGRAVARVRHGRLERREHVGSPVEGLAGRRPEVECGRGLGLGRHGVRGRFVTFASRSTLRRLGLRKALLLPASSGGRRHAVIVPVFHHPRLHRAPWSEGARGRAWPRPAAAITRDASASASRATP